MEKHTDWIYTETARLRLREDGLIHVEISAEKAQQPSDAVDNLTVASSFCRDKRRGVILDLRGTSPLPAETRKVYMDPVMGQSYKALALVVSSDKVSRLMANIYMLVARLPFPMRLCLTLEEASEWLHTFDKTS
jgi:hypothetical protein